MIKLLLRRPLYPLCAGTLLLMAQCGNAQTTNAQAIADGKAFSASMLPTSKTKPVSASANPATALPTNAPDKSPLYDVNQPASGGFTSGVGLVTQGSAAITKCQNYTPSGNAVADQECAGVNFLANNPIQAQFIIQPNDPARVSFNTAMASVTATDITGQQCVLKTVTTPGVFEKDMCSQSLQIDTFTCNKQLIPECAYKASPISTLNIASTGVLSGSLTPLAEEGTYSFTIAVPGGCPRPRGTSAINFNLDSIGFGSYININMNSIDDAGAVAVNGIPVWAGYPNAGPAYTYAALGSPTAATFVQDYSWTETATTPASPATYDSYGYQTSPAQPAKDYTASYFADTKILDHCPSGYVAQQLSLPYCVTTNDRDSQTTTCGLTNPSDTRIFASGFFCNGKGEFLMNNHEGSGSRSAALGNNMPLKQGINSINVFWGTDSNDGGACGEMTVTGTIHNVAPKCSSSWVDGCAAARTSLAP